MRVVLCNCPPDAAERIARALVEQRVAACVNVIPAVTSFYWWKGEIQRDGESTLLIKTAADRVADLMAAIRAAHPYEVPEIVALPVGEGEVHEPYLRWVRAETR